MKLLAAAFVALALAPTVARADDPGMQLMQIMMRCPAMSADGKHVAIYSLAGGDDKAAKTSLVVFGANGKLEQRVPVVPPATDVARATADAAKIVKLLDDGGYKRMSRVASKGGATAKNGDYSTDLSSEDAALKLEIVKRKITITGTRGGKKLAPIKLTLPAKDGACASSVSFSVANTMAGYDKASKQLAFEVGVFGGDAMCFAHDYVVTLK